MKDGLIKFAILNEMTDDSLQIEHGRLNFTNKLFVYVSYVLLHPRSNEDDVQIIDGKV